MAKQLGATTLALTAGLVLATAVWGQQQSQERSEQFGEYRVYYNLVNSNFLHPEIARRYNIERSNDVAVLTVSVRAPDESGRLADQPADVSGGVSDRVHFYSLDFDEFREPQSVYYIAEVPAEGMREFDISLEIEPEGSEQSIELEVTETLGSRELPPTPQ